MEFAASQPCNEQKSQAACGEIAQIVTQVNMKFYSLSLGTYITLTK